MKSWKQVKKILIVESISFIVTTQVHGSRLEGDED